MTRDEIIAVATSLHPEQGALLARQAEWEAAFVEFARAVYRQAWLDATGITLTDAELAVRCGSD